MEIRHRVGGLDANGVLRKSLLKVTRGYIVMSVTYVYVLVDQGGIFQITDGKKNVFAFRYMESILN